MKTDEKESKMPIIPELRIELTCNAMKKCSTVGIKGATEAMVLLDGVKELIEDHMIFDIPR